MTEPGRVSAPAAGACPAPAIFQATSGLRSFDNARFIGGPPNHGPLKKSEFGYAAMFQPKLRRVTEVAVDGGPDLVLLMLMSTSHVMDVWLEGKHRRMTFRRGDLAILPPGVESRWCAADGQASVVHLHISGDRLADAASPCALSSIRPGLGLRDTRLQQILRKAARLDELDPLVSLKVAALGAAALLHTLRTAGGEAG